MRSIGRKPFFERCCVKKYLSDRDCTVTETPYAERFYLIVLDGGLFPLR